MSSTALEALLAQHGFEKDMGLGVCLLVHLRTYIHTHTCMRVWVKDFECISELDKAYTTTPSPRPGQVRQEINRHPVS